MKTIQRRDKLKIYGDLLNALSIETDPEKIVLSRIQLRTNLPFDRLKEYISDMIELGFVQDETSLVVTEKGREYLAEYEKILGFMKRMGLSYL